MKWAYLTTASSQLEAEMWRDMLTEYGVLAMVGQGDTQSFLGVSGYPCRLMVAEDQLERAKEVMEEWQGGHEGRHGEMQSGPDGSGA